MSRYIDEDKLLQKLSRMIDYCEKDNKVNGLTALFQVGDAIMDCPTADVEKRKHGRWEYNKDDGGMYCSACGEIACSDWDEYHEGKYCPNCGAKMDGERREDNV
jgi:rubredoxin